MGTWTISKLFQEFFFYIYKELQLYQCQQLFYWIIFRQCLDLVQEISPPIQEELDMIEGLSLLSSYDVQTLPLQGTSLISIHGGGIVVILLWCELINKTFQSVKHLDVFVNPPTTITMVMYLGQLCLI